MNRVNLFRVLLSCVVLPACGAAHAQPRDVDAGVSESWKEMYRDSHLTDEERSGANPCLRPDRFFSCTPGAEARALRYAWAE